MEIPKRNEGEPEVPLKELILREAEEKKERAAGYGHPEVQENVSRNYKVVVEHLKQLPPGEYPDMSSLIRSLNEIASDGVRFPNVDDEVTLNNIKYKITAIFPPGARAASEISKKYSDINLTFASRANIWDQTFDRGQVLLPGSYILEEA